MNVCFQVEVLLRRVPSCYGRWPPVSNRPRMFAWELSTLYVSPQRSPRTRLARAVAQWTSVRRTVTSAVCGDGGGDRLTAADHCHRHTSRTGSWDTGPPREDTGTTTTPVCGPTTPVRGKTTPVRGETTPIQDPNNPVMWSSYPGAQSNNTGVQFNYAFPGTQPSLQPSLQTLPRAALTCYVYRISPQQDIMQGP